MFLNLDHYEISNANTEKEYYEDKITNILSYILYDKNDDFFYKFMDFIKFFKHIYEKFANIKIVNNKPFKSYDLIYNSLTKTDLDYRELYENLEEIIKIYGEYLQFKAIRKRIFIYHWNENK